MNALLLAATLSPCTRNDCPDRNETIDVPSLFTVVTVTTVFAPGAVNAPNLTHGLLIFMTPNPLAVLLLLTAGI
jgi:hypothetical protein